MATARTATSNSSTASALGNLPTTLGDELLEAFRGITTNFREGRWEPSELNGGKLCEVVYTILRGHTDGSFPAQSSKPPNMVAACRDLEKAPTSFPRSIRIQMPRMLVSLYEIRNNRGVGHVGGEVNANHMDAVAVLYMAKWLVAELVRVFHAVDTVTATQVVDALVERELPVIWQVGGLKRVLQPKLSMKDKMLLLLYSEPGPVPEERLISWIEHSNPTVFRRDVVRPAHRSRLIEYDEAARTLELSPVGTRWVEEHLSLALT